MDNPVGVPDSDIFSDVSRRLFNYQAYGCSFKGDDCISLSSRLYLKYENDPPKCALAMDYKFPELTSPLCKESYEYILMVLSDPAAIINHGPPEELAKQARTFGTNPWSVVSTLRLITQVIPDGTVVEHIQYSPSQFSLGMDDVLIVIQQIDVFDAISHCHELVCHRGAFTTYAEVKKNTTLCNMKTLLSLFQYVFPAVVQSCNLQGLLCHLTKDLWSVPLLIFTGCRI